MLSPLSFEYYNIGRLTKKKINTESPTFLVCYKYYNKN